MRGACASSASSRRRMMRPSFLWSWCSSAVGRNVSSLSITTQCGEWMLRASEMTVQLLPSVKPIVSWSRSSTGISTDLMATAGKIKAEYDETPLRHEAE